MSAVQPGADDTPDPNKIMPEADAEEWRKRAEELFKPPSIQPLPKGQTPDLSKLKNQLGYTPAEAWQKCAAAIENYDITSCKAYREEIDTLLVFAGLFSAVVTAFTIESYQWLQSDPNDTIIALLSQIAQSGSPSQTIQAPAGLPAAISVRINAYWFLSLTLSLAAALVAILCKQWVREFERRGDQSPDVYIRVRQTKLEGFEGWSVASTVAAVPLVLQSALGLFALGLIELLWELHKTVALVVLVPTSAAVVFYTATTLLPGLQLLCSPYRLLYTVSQCPFKSPQALLALRLQALLWKAFCALSFDVLPTILYLTFEQCYRKCIVFYLRVYAVIWPEHLSALQDGNSRIARTDDAVRGRFQYLRRSCRTLWQRLLRPWRCNEGVFYISHRDRPTWPRFLRWWRTRLPFLPCSRRVESPLTVIDPVFLPMPKLHGWNFSRDPTFHGSWITLDRRFTASRDGEHEFSEFGRLKRNVVPVRSTFRGLAWLLNQTDHPGLPQWIWLSIWDIAVNLNHWTVARHLHEGILHLIRQCPPNSNYQPGLTARPFAVVFEYALWAKIDPRVMGELFVLLLPSLQSSLAQEVWSLMTFRLGTDDDIWRSGLHAILDQLLDAGPMELERFGRLLFHASAALESHSGSLSQPELACIIALHFREQRSYGGVVFAAFSYSSLLANLSLRYLAADQGTRDQLCTVKSTFSALALAIDNFLGQLDGPHEAYWSDKPGLYELSDEACRRVYLGLLSDQTHVLPGGISGAEDRLARYLGRLQSSNAVQHPGDYGEGNQLEARTGYGSYYPPRRDPYHMLLPAQIGPSSPRTANEGGASVSE